MSPETKAADLNNDQRHQDLMTLADTMHSVKKTILTAIVPLMIAGIGALVSTHYQQKALVSEVSQLNYRLTTMTDQLERVNEKVIVMWAGGEWQNKYPTR